MAERDPATGRFPRGSGMPAMGRGYGGPARGASWATWTAGHRPDPEALRRGKAMAIRLRELLEPHIGKVAATWIEVMSDPTAPPQARITAAEKIAERVEGKVSDRIAMVDARLPEELSDAELAAIAGRGRRGAADAEADQG